MSTSKSALPLLAIAGLALAGLALSGYLTYLHYRVFTDPSYQSVCAVNPRFDCETVAASRFSIIAGVPVAVWGGIGYLAALVLVLVASRNREELATAAALLGLGVVFGAVSLGLLAISLALVRSLCLLCAGTYLINFAIAVLAVAWARRVGGLAAVMVRGRKVLRGNAITVCVGAGVIVLFLGAVRYAFPSYWATSAWRKGFTGTSGRTENGLPWIGALRPTLTVHEFFDFNCPHCRLAHGKLRRLLLAHPHELRIVRHDFPRMSCLESVSSPNSERCLAARAAHCALLQGDYWKWNDGAIARAARDPDPFSVTRERTFALAVALGFNRPVFAGCLDAEDTFAAVQSVYIDAKRQQIKETPIYLVDQKKRDLASLAKLIKERL